MVVYLTDLIKKLEENSDQLIHGDRIDRMKAFDKAIMWNKVRKIIEFQGGIEYE